MDFAPDASLGPWAVPSDVAWIETGVDVLVLPLRPPYGQLPYRLAGSGALIWQGLADGLDLAGLVAELGDGCRDRAQEITAFVSELEESGLIVRSAGSL